MVRVCGTYWGEQKCIQGFDRNDGNRHLEDLGIDKTNIKRNVKETAQDTMDWIYLAVDWDK